MAMILVNKDRELLVNTEVISHVIPNKNQQGDYTVSFHNGSQYLISQKEFNQLKWKMRQGLEDYVE